MDKPTPAPWRIMVDSTGAYFAVYAMPHARTKVICPVKIADEADAHLIAAAPELLEAVRAGGRYSDALRRYQEQGVRGQMIPGTDELETLLLDWHDKGHAAIAKAEGRS